MDALVLMYDEIIKPYEEDVQNKSNDEISFNEKK